MIYVYGPNGLAIEQINNSSGTVQYLHHDQTGSARLLTGSNHWDLQALFDDFAERFQWRVSPPSD